MEERILPPLVAICCGMFPNGVDVYTPWCGSVWKGFGGGGFGGEGCVKGLVGAICWGCC